MSWHVGSDDRGALFHYSCGAEGEGEGLVGIVKEEKEERGREEVDMVCSYMWCCHAV